MTFADLSLCRQALNQVEGSKDHHRRTGVVGRIPGERPPFHKCPMPVNLRAPGLQDALSTRPVRHRGGVAACQDFPTGAELSPGFAVDGRVTLGAV